MERVVEKRQNESSHAAPKSGEPRVETGPAARPGQFSFEPYAWSSALKTQPGATVSPVNNGV